MDAINEYDAQWLYVAYSMIGLMAFIVIQGALYERVRRSSSYKRMRRLLLTSKGKDARGRQEEEEEEEEDGDEVTDVISSREAYRVPVIGSLALFSLYLAYRYLPRMWLNLLLGMYFAGVGVIAVSKALHFTITWFLRDEGTTLDDLLRRKGRPDTSLPRKSSRSTTGIGQTTHRRRQVFDLLTDKYILTLTHKNHNLAHVSIDLVTMISFIVGVPCCLAYVYTKNWILNNLLAVSFCFLAIQLIILDSFRTGMILLMGLFFYDIFWVFGTEVMVTVAKSFDAPFKLVFPRHLLRAIMTGQLRHVMLGLGDIVVPGIFIALCLQFDYDQAEKRISKKGLGNLTSITKPYFKSCLMAYMLGLMLTITMMHIFKAAQPALLYLSPACILSSIICACWRGELAAILSYTNEHNGKSKTSPVTSTS